EGRNIAIKLARAVAALHRANIIHRDIKPDNVILERDGSLKLIDLGVVRVTGLEDSTPDNIPGTRAYMAPEMFDGEAGTKRPIFMPWASPCFAPLPASFPMQMPTLPVRRVAPGQSRFRRYVRTCLPGWRPRSCARLPPFLLSVLAISLNSPWRWKLDRRARLLH